MNRVDSVKVFLRDLGAYHSCHDLLKSRHVTLEEVLSGSRIQDVVECRHAILMNAAKAGARATTIARIFGISPDVVYYAVSGRGRK